ncbi:MAG: hypothetical protein GYA42_05795 [Syntrophomonadaceae bacterium]|nr:hypothetical protein [Syntrophomonadaceae bacterium]
MSKKLLTLVLAVIAVLTFSAFLGGCEKAAEKATEKAIEQSSGGDAKVDLDKNQVTIKTDQGTTTVGETTQWPSKMPADVPKFKYGKITAVSETTTADKGVAEFIAIEGVALADLTKYTSELESAGWKIEATTTMTDGYMVSAVKGEQNLVVSFSKGDKDFSGGIYYTQKK